jgi:hypothetical protein
VPENPENESTAKIVTPNADNITKAAVDNEIFEEVSEYRIGEGPPPLPLIIMFLLIVTWALFSWIPFFHY